MITRKSIIIRFKWLAALVLFLITVQPSFADDRAKLLGIWRLVSYEVETQATGEREPVLGKNPTGNIIFTPEGRMMVVLTGEGRKAPTTDQDRADLFKSMVAYTGMYRVDGDKWLTKVDVACEPRLGGHRTDPLFPRRWRPAPREHGGDAMGGPTRKGDGAVHSYV